MGVLIKTLLIENKSFVDSKYKPDTSPGSWILIYYL